MTENNSRYVKSDLVGYQVDYNYSTLTAKNELFCKKLPKIELHAHLNGSLSSNSLKNLDCSNEIIAEYEKLIKYLKDSKNTNRLEKCFRLFKIPHDLTTNREKVYRATKCVIQEFFDENVIYLELRTTPREEKNMTKIEYIEAVIQAINDCEYDIIVKLLLSIDRKCDEEVAKDTIQLIAKMKDQYPNIIKGVDFSGHPLVGTFNKALFEWAKAHGLYITLHCAEIREKNDEIKEMLNIKPHRLGHATFLHPQYGGSLDNWNLYCSLKIPLECCLTSNVSCGTSKSYGEHHLQKWIENNLPFSLSTDDKGIFDTNLSQELFLAMEHFNLSPQDIWKMTYNSVEFTFASQDEKMLLRAKLEDWKIKNQF